MTSLARERFPAPARARLSRLDAFRAAGRHTWRVRLLRRTIMSVVIAGMAAILVFAAFNSFRSAMPGLSVEGLGLNGTRVTMERPKLAGFHTDGRPYTVLAKSAVQDAKTPNILELHEIDAHVTMSDGSLAHVVSSFGIYDSSKETMQLKQDVHLTTDAGSDVRMSSAFVEFKTGSVDTRDAVTVVMSTGTVIADSMHMVDNGKQVTFEGHVRSLLLPAPAAATTVGSLKATNP